MLLGGFFRGLDVLELWRVDCELVERTSSQIVHGRSRQLLDVFLFLGAREPAYGSCVMAPVDQRA